MDILKARIELHRMSRRDLFNLAVNQKISKCLIGGRPCGFYLQYRGSSFCVSEILGKGCQVERLEQFEQFNDEREEVNFSLPFLQKKETEFLLPGKKAVEFNVYHRNPLTRSTVFLGKITERRRKERGNNLKDLLNKAVKQYSDYVDDPSTIFLLS
jgi:hypothetical protein